MQIHLDAEIPLKICQHCYEKMNELNLFRVQCLRALNILTSLKKKKRPAESIETCNEFVVPIDTLFVSSN